MLVEMAVGDGFGAGLEYVNPKAVRALNHPNRGYLQHPRHKGIKPGMYTDDTHMAIALAQLVLEDPQAIWTPGVLANAFLVHFKADPRDGFARGFQGFLGQTNTPEEFLANIRFGSPKSGGAMRAAPVGLYKDPMEVMDRAVQQASITHCSHVGLGAAKAAALVVHFCYYEVDTIDYLPPWLDEMLPGFDWDVPWRGKVRSPANQPVRAAITALADQDSLTEVLRACVACTGDVDTVAAIAMPAAAVSRYHDNDLPKKLFDDLENGQFGLDYLRGLDEQLLAAFPR